jgi:hypothetical protein
MGQDGKLNDDNISRSAVETHLSRTNPQHQTLSLADAHTTTSKQLSPTEPSHSFNPISPEQVPSSNKAEAAKISHKGAWCHNFKVLVPNYQMVKSFKGGKAFKVDQVKICLRLSATRENVRASKFVISYIEVT